jgi:hypothetical protein
LCDFVDIQRQAITKLADRSPSEVAEWSGIPASRRILKEQIISIQRRIQLSAVPNEHQRPSYQHWLYLAGRAVVAAFEALPALLGVVECR